jgi:hypothetical protein
MNTKTQEQINNTKGGFAKLKKNEKFLQKEDPLKRKIFILKGKIRQNDEFSNVLQGF